MLGDKVRLHSRVRADCGGQDQIFIKGIKYFGLFGFWPIDTEIDPYVLTFIYLVIPLQRTQDEPSKASSPKHCAWKACLQLKTWVSDKSAEFKLTMRPPQPPHNVSSPMAKPLEAAWNCFWSRLKQSATKILLQPSCKVT